MPKILIVDDELSMREFLSILLEKEGFKTIAVKDGEKALVKLEKFTPANDMYLLDLLDTLNS